MVDGKWWGGGKEVWRGVEKEHSFQDVSFQ